MGLGRNALEEGGGRIVEKAGFTRDPPEPITDINRMQRDLGMTGPTRRARFAEVTGMAGQIPNRWLGKGVEGGAKEDWEEEDGRLPNPARGVGRRGRQTLENVDTGMGEQLPSLNLHHANMALESAHVPQIPTIAQNEHAHRMPWSMHYLDRTGTVGGGAMAFPPRAVASETRGDRPEDSSERMRYVHHLPPSSGSEHRQLVWRSAKQNPHDGRAVQQGLVDAAHQGEAFGQGTLGEFPDSSLNLPPLVRMRQRTMGEVPPERKGQTRNTGVPTQITRAFLGVGSM